ncbi:OLC1v1036559C1 [Oldenlandia corymbosa var. corymbosa]|uniref:OLC1v1036559C1 n=1 Tax=Oldenlandia corymbosa var. corymbosa TaxID=529605 RepID=A0AAV1CYA9_OLDCO|nr:OLC1v1036559C1 [Oldenlandia corymbosa var. corymbosa]
MAPQPSPKVDKSKEVAKEVETVKKNKGVLLKPSKVKWQPNLGVVTKETGHAVSSSGLTDREKSQIPDDVSDNGAEKEKRGTRSEIDGDLHRRIKTACYFGTTHCL